MTERTFNTPRGRKPSVITPASIRAGSPRQNTPELNRRLRRRKENP